MNSTPKPATILPLKLVCRAFVSIPGATLADLDKLSPEEISAIGAKLTDDDWEVVSVERAGGFEVDLATMEDADLLPTATIARSNGKPCMRSRAAEIGISLQTLYRWQREDGVNVFDDEEITAHVATRRSHSWHISPKFKRGGK
jgi:hypothetical protein